MKRKQFVKGITQIAQEGAIQIFQELKSGMEEIIVGVVGVLQFDVLKFRLESEYSVEIRLDMLPYEHIRWIENYLDIILVLEPVLKHVKLKNTYNAYVFAVNNNNTAENHAPMKLYSLKIWDDGTLVRHFVPCVRRDGVAGLYDITPGAVKKFYANDGTGTFEAGPVLESSTTGMVIIFK